MSSTPRKVSGKEQAEEPGRRGFYQPKGRTRHSSVVINKDIFVWGGSQESLPQVHMSDEKHKIISVVEVFRRMKGRWEQHSTTGTPPLGVIGCASCAIGHKIYYFGGWCNHDECRYNSLHELDTNDLKWRVCLADSDNGPMKKESCVMVAFHQTLLVVGGFGIPPKNSQPLAQYDGKKFVQRAVCTNEHHIHALGTDQWTIPTISGDKPPPTSLMTLNKYADEKVLMYGGTTPDGVSSDLRVANVIGNNVHWERLVFHGPEKPKGRWGHAVTIIHSPLMGDQQTLLLMTGGRYAPYAGCNDSWLLSIGDGASWREVKNMRSSLMKGYRHTINTIAASKSCVWMMVIRRDFPHPNFVFLELILSPNGLWELGSVLKDDEIYRGYGERFSLRFPTDCQTNSLAAAAAVPAGRKKEAQLEQQLQHAHLELQKKGQQIQEKEQRLQYFQQQLQEKDQQIRDKDRQIQEKEQSLQYSQQQLQEKDQQIQRKNQQIQSKDQQIHDKDQHLQLAQQQVQHLQSNLSQLSTEPWVVSREELTITQKVLGTGAYGEVRVATFRGLRVAAKFLHNIITSEYNLHLLSREMTIAAQVRHPNLLLFIGATTQCKPLIILTELMATSLRAELHRGQISWKIIKSIAIDVSCGLNYLHMKKPDPIIHRDVSSPNVLMEPFGAGSWRAKVSDFGSANFVHQVTSASVYPGNPSYAAPEANLPNKHSPKMDVYSFGVLLTEMSLHQPPKTTVSGRAQQARMVQFYSLAIIIQECMELSSDNRPTFERVMEKLRQIQT